MQSTEDALSGTVTTEEAADALEAAGFPRIKGSGDVATLLDAMPEDDDE